jgi:hypothetical protein
MLPTTEQRSISVQLICLSPPSRADDEPVIFGLQNKDRELDSGATQPSGAILFVFQLTVRRTPDGTLRFSGPYAHGTASDPFFYLGLAPMAEPTSWIRRWKIGLAAITWDDVCVVAERDGAVLEGTLAELTGTRPPLVGGEWVVCED